VSWRLRPSLQLVPLSSDELYLYQRSGDSLHMKLPGSELCRFVARLARGLPATELEPAARADGVEPDLARQLLDVLEARAALMRADERSLPAPEAERFSRQLNMLAEHESVESTRYDYHERLRRARVVLLGVGSLGGWALQQLVAAGVGHVTLVDDDRVSSSNLARQCLFGEADVGRPKVAAAADAVRRQSRYTELVALRRGLWSTDDIAEVMAEGTDLVILTADQPVWRIARWAAGAARRRDVALLRGNSLGIGPLYLPGRSACPACAWPRLLRDVPGAEAIIERQRALGVAPGRALVSEVGLAGSLLADEALSFLSGARQPRTINAQLYIESPLQVGVRPFDRCDDCPECGVQ
jgi:molybdopterin/thiamine biosynthesis adenylyltransferase